MPALGKMAHGKSKRYLPWIFCCICLHGSLAGAQSPPSPPPLHERIDRCLEQAHVGPAVETVTDAQFLRRVYLDLAGTIPTAGEARQFLTDSSPNKRAALVDRLLASPRFARRMQYAFDAMWMERRPKFYIEPTEWSEYLYTSFQEEKPLNELAREVLAADGAKRSPRAAARFYLDREADPHAVTRDVGRIFFGQDLQCAQCHDHPLIEDYHQADYHGLFAFIHRGYALKDKNEVSYYAEKGEGQVNYESVFTGEGAEHVPPKLPAAMPVVEPVFGKGTEHEVPPADGVLPVPKYSRREKLAELATCGTNREFNRNLANRLWTLMLGQGVVDPPDLHHAENPPTHPELLALLADALADSEFDVKTMLREIVLSRAYQRGTESGRVTPEQFQTIVDDREAWRMEMSRLRSEAEQLRESAGEILSRGETAEAEVSHTLGALAAARQALADAQQTVVNTERELASTRQQLATQETLVTVLQRAAEAGQAVKAQFQEDESLGKAADAFSARSAEAAKKLEELRAKIPATEEALKKARDAVPPEEEKVPPLESAWQAAAANREALEPEIRQARGNQDRALGLAQQADYLESLLAEADALAKIDGCDNDISTLHAQGQKLADSLAEANTRLDGLRANLTEHKASHAAAIQKWESAHQETLAAREAVATVEGTWQEVQALVERFPDDAKMAAAAELLGIKTEQLRSELATHNEIATNLERERDAAAACVAEAQESVSEQAARQQAIQAEQAVLARRLKEAEAALVQARQDAERMFDAWASSATRRFAIAPLSSLSPEQLAWSMMTATGIVEEHRAAVLAELEKAASEAKEPTEEGEAQKQAAPSVSEEERPHYLERKIHERLKGNVDQFVRYFGTSPGSPPDDFQASVHQALFLTNGSLVSQWLAPNATRLTGRLANMQDSRELAEELYLAVLTRFPEAEEKELVRDYLAGAEQDGADRQAAIQEMVWGLLGSNEFRFRR